MYTSPLGYAMVTKPHETMVPARTVLALEARVWWLTRHSRPLACSDSGSTVGVGMPKCWYAKDIRLNPP